MKILTIITTYNRPKLFQKLIDALVVEMNNSGYKHTLLIADDCSTPEYAANIANKAQENGHNTHVMRTPENGGKENYWYLMHQLYQKAKGMEWDILFQLPDDVLPVTLMYKIAVKQLQKIPSEQVLINLYRCYRDAQWGSTEPFDFDANIRFTGWMDMCYACKRPAIQAIAYSVHPVFRNWQTTPELGSGVGAQLSRRLRWMGVNQYQFLQSLVIDDGNHKSKMNPGRTFKMKTL